MRDCMLRAASESVRNGLHVYSKTAPETSTHRRVLGGYGTVSTDKLFAQRRKAGDSGKRIRILFRIRSGCRSGTVCCLYHQNHIYSPKQTNQPDSGLSTIGRWQHGCVIKCEDRCWWLGEGRAVSREQQRGLCGLINVSPARVVLCCCGQLRGIDSVATMR
jgi:hypothetical protein